MGRGVLVVNFGKCFAIIGTPMYTSDHNILLHVELLTALILLIISTIENHIFSYNIVDCESTSVMQSMAYSTMKHPQQTA